MAGLINGDGRAANVDPDGLEDGDDDEFDEDAVYYEDDDDEIEEEGVVTAAVVGEHAAAKKKGNRGIVGRPRRTSAWSSHGSSSPPAC